MDRTNVVIGLLSSIAGGLLVAILNFLFNRKKIVLERQKLALEIEKLKNENERLQDSFVKLNASVQEAANRRLVHKIKLDYTDSPLNHGWQIVEQYDESEPNLRCVMDGFRGRIWEVRRKNRYAMDFKLNPTIGHGSYIEFIVKLEEEAAQIFAQIIVQSKDFSQSEKIWLAFTIGTAKPRLKFALDSKFDWEWIVYVTPKRLEGNWQLFQIDLMDVVTRLVGDEGWQFTGQITTFRLRGNLSIDYISILN